MFGKMGDVFVWSEDSETGKKLWDLRTLWLADSRLVLVIL